MKISPAIKSCALWVPLWLLFCAPSFAQASPADTIRVGVLLPLTGKLAEAGRMEEKAFFMATEEINAQGGIRGKEVELVTADTAGDEGKGGSAMESLIGNKEVAAVCGGISGSATFAAASVAQKRNVPFLVSTAAANEITEKGWDHVFRLSAARSDQPKSLMSFLSKALKIQTAAIHYEDSPLGRYGMKEFAAQCKAMGIDILLMRRHEPGAKGFDPFLTKMSLKGPQMLCVVSTPEDAAFFMAECRRADVHPILFFARGEGFARPDFGEMGAELCNHVCAATLWAPSVPYPGAREFFERYSTRFGVSPDYHAAQAYAAMYVLKSALHRAATHSPGGIREALAKTDAVTVFGPVKFQSQGRMARQNTLPTLVVQWIDGKLETVWPREIASAPYVFPFPGWNER